MSMRSLKWGGGTRFDGAFTVMLGHCTEKMRQG